jgi:ABC-type uncharacterized transport system substrate-binding protein
MNHELRLEVIPVLDGMRGMPLTVTVPTYFIESHFELVEQRHELEQLRLQRRIDDLVHASAATKKKKRWRRHG